MSENKPKILVVSDIHLGSFGSERDLFIQFLKRVINGEFGSELQAFIILGDFIDLCTDTPGTLLKRKKIQEILQLLLELKEKMKLIFLLGNHEIPVTGDLDDKFVRRKKKYLNRFRNSNFKELFTDESHYQYALLKKYNNEDMLLMYNSREQLENNPIKKVKIEGLNLDSEYGCLMAHGYQFESEVYMFFIAQFWRSLISGDKFEVKETYDYFWNQIIKKGRKIKPIRFDTMIEEIAKIKGKSIELVDRAFSELNIIEFNFLKNQMKVMKKWQRASKPDYFLSEIKEFLEDDDYDFSKINHVVYGHSHYKEISYATINRQQVEVINDGSWQHSQPSYVEIFAKGKMYLRTVANNN